MNRTNHTDNAFRLVAHRGGLYHRPENTIAAFENMYNQGVRWVEFDVRMSRDNVPILFHDERIHIPGSGNRVVRELDLADLQKVDVGGGELLPTVRELFEKFDRSFSYDIELKVMDAVEEVVRLVREFDLAGQTILTSFIPEALQLSSELIPEVARGFLLDRLTGRLVDEHHAVRAACLLGCECLLPHHRILTAEWTQAAQAEGLKVIPWTVNKLADARRLLNIGVDGFVSDRPDYLRGLVESGGGLI